MCCQFSGGDTESPTGELPSHSHNAICSTTGEHTHGYWYNDGGNGHSSYNGTANWDYLNQTTSAGNHSHTITIGDTGGNKRHENMPPYVIINRWKRTA